MGMRVMNSFASRGSGGQGQGRALEASSPINLTKLRDRVDLALEALSREAWLPMGLRTVLVEEISRFRALVNAREPDVVALAKQMNSIALFAFSYGDAVANSEAVTQIRILDLELEGARRKENLNRKTGRRWPEDGHVVGATRSGETSF